MTVVSGARGGRTLTLLPTTDFKSVASADSAIAPAGIFYYKNEKDHTRFCQGTLYKTGKISRGGQIEKKSTKRMPARQTAKITTRKNGRNILRARVLLRATIIL